MPILRLRHSDPTTAVTLFRPSFGRRSGAYCGSRIANGRIVGMSPRAGDPEEHRTREPDGGTEDKPLAGGCLSPTNRGQSSPGGRDEGDDSIAPPRLFVNRLRCEVDATALPARPAMVRRSLTPPAPWYRENRACCKLLDPARGASPTRHPRHRL
jgi:hypothetical protein